MFWTSHTHFKTLSNREAGEAHIEQMRNTINFLGVLIDAVDEVTGISTFLEQTDGATMLYI